MEAQLHAPMPRSAFPRPRLRRDEASRYLLEVHGVSYTPQTLANLAHRGGGPRFQKLGKTPLYPKEELDRWIEDRLGNLKGSTSE